MQYNNPSKPYGFLLDEPKAGYFVSEPEVEYVACPLADSNTFGGQGTPRALRFENLRKGVMPFARAQGYVRDDDVFADVS
uniref:Uncharacterized protein n=1 Tax=Candidatus Kentrum sp. DK TaxID=2126562 RepID=A0A450TCI9_9GAMM|nr:MAG: hypothetical protein BECKDK2373B_GA0170837_11388 [Candidatus Kentron sp. DK]